MDPLRLEDRDARELFDEIASRGAAALGNFAAALSTLGRAGIWTAVETGRRSAIVKYLLPRRWTTRASTTGSRGGAAARSRST